jgi:hypothetical protein
VLALLALGAIGTGVGYVLNYRIITDDGPLFASTVTYLLPVVSLPSAPSCFTNQLPPGSQSESSSHSADHPDSASAVQGSDLRRRTNLTVFCLVTGDALQFCAS